MSARAKLHLENLTRWLSSYLLLHSFYKAYKRNAFSSENPCPIALEEIEKYMQILLPAYQFNLVMQKNDATIGDVIPAVKIIISKWSRFNCTGAYQDLCNNLIKQFNHKFDYELNSNVYRVASLMNTHKIWLWYTRPDCDAIRTAAMASIYSVNKIFSKNETEHEENPISETDIDEENLFSLFSDASYVQSQV